MWKSCLPLSFLSNAAIIAQLVDQDSKWWKTTLIDQDFLHFEVQKIKIITLCTFPQDLLFWPHSSSRVYTVKSGYHLLHEDNCRHLASNSDSSASRSFWSTLWKPRSPIRLKPLCGEPAIILCLLWRIWLKGKQLHPQFVTFVSKLRSLVYMHYGSVNNLNRSGKWIFVIWM